MFESVQGLLDEHDAIQAQLGDLLFMLTRSWPGSWGGGLPS